MSGIGRRLAVLVVAGSIAASGGCGELTSGGAGEVEVYAVADESGTGDGTAPSAAASAPAAARAAEGQLAVQLQLFLRADSDGRWVELSDGVRDVTLELGGGGERRVAVRFLASGFYSGFRVVFHGVQAFVTGGVTVEGLPFTGTATVDLGSGTLTVEREVLVAIEDEASIDLVLDLNADLWLPTVSPATRLVAAAALESAVAVRLR